MGCPPGHLKSGEIQLGDGRQKAEKGHGRKLLLSIPCLLTMEDGACRPGPEGVVGDRQQPQSWHLSQYWPQTCPAVPGCRGSPAPP